MGLGSRTGEFPLHWFPVGAMLKLTILIPYWLLL